MRSTYACSQGHESDYCISIHASTCKSYSCARHINASLRIKYRQSSHQPVIRTVRKPGCGSDESGAEKSNAEGQSGPECICTSERGTPKLFRMIPRVLIRPPNSDTIIAHASFCVFKGNNCNGSAEREIGTARTGKHANKPAQSALHVLKSQTTCPQTVQCLNQP